jgi:hypothetical protein
VHENEDDVLLHVPTKRSFPKGRLVDPQPYGYRLLAAVVDRRLPFAYAWESRRKRRLLESLKAHASALRKSGGVRDVAVFKALIVPPGRGRFLKERPDVRVARYDVAVLVETATPEQAKMLDANPHWLALQSEVRRITSDVFETSGSNVRSMGEVDHERDGVFLFNYFYSDRLDRNLAVFNYTAGWFQDQTGLNNSTVILPREKTDYTMINHARWNRLLDILPALLFKASFREFVLRYFEANQTAAMPILYRLA